LGVREGTNLFTDGGEARSEDSSDEFIEGAQQSEWAVVGKEGGVPCLEKLHNLAREEGVWDGGSAKDVVDKAKNKREAEVTALYGAGRGDGVIGNVEGSIRPDQGLEAVILDTVKAGG
jgi:hypothetical protein